MGKIILIGFALLASLAHATERIGLVEQAEQVANALADKINVAGKSRVAVLDIISSDGDHVTELGRVLVELLNAYLASSSHPLEVVDRRHLENVLKEQKLSKSGLFNPKTSAEIGKLSGVEAVITGTFSEIGGKILIILKIINTETAANIGSELLSLEQSAEIKKLHDNIISGETDAYTTSDKVYVNSAMFYTDRDTISCRGLGTFKSYPHALAYACAVQPDRNGAGYACQYLGESGDHWTMTASREKYPYGNNNCNNFPQAAMRRLLQEAGR